MHSEQPAQTGRPLFGAGITAQTLRAQLPQLRFAGLHNDYGVDLRSRSPLSGNTIAQVLRSLTLRHIMKGSEPGTLKLTLGRTELDRLAGWQLSDPSALADMMTLVPRPVDVLIRATAHPDTFRAVMTATGKRLMYPDAKLYMGPIEWGIATAKNREFQVSRRLYNNYVRDLETLVMERAGVTDRAKVFQDLDGTHEFSSLEALYYGKNGLVDAILAGPDRVITRKNLDQYLKKANLGPEALETFLATSANALKVAQEFSTPLAEFSPESVAGADYSHYRSLKSFDKLSRLGTHKETSNRKPVFYFFDGDKAEQNQNNIKSADAITKITALPLQALVNDRPAFSRIMVDNVPGTTHGILDDDVIFYNDPFMDELADQTTRALLALHDKKKAQKQRTPSKAVSHIKLLVNSPGGEVDAGREIKNVIQHDIRDVPVDVIVSGMAASCGAYLLSSATGNRFATPMARIMVHEAHWGVSSHGRLLNQMGDSLNQTTLDYFNTISEATGRPVDVIAQDSINDLWLNPVEALFYGEKGLIDGILVSPTEAITRKDVEKYLLDRYKNKFKSKTALDDHVENHFLSRRGIELRAKMTPQHLNDTEPFSNSVQIIRETVAYLKEQDMEGRMLLAKRFKGAAPPKTYRTIDYYNLASTDLEGYYAEDRAQAQTGPGDLRNLKREPRRP